MLNVLKSDLYKLSLRKSFYICGLLSGAFGVFLVVLLNNLFSAGDIGFNGIRSIVVGIDKITIFVAVVLSVFVPSEFALGTIKNSVSKGISRVEIYLSKLAVGVFVSLAYTLFSGLCGFVSGSIMWGVGTVSTDEALGILKVIGLFLLAEVCVQSVFIMVGFLVRHTGATAAINLVIILVADQVVFPIIDYVVEHWALLGYTIKSSEYWVGSYVSTFLDENIKQEMINKGLAVCLVYLVLATAIGIIDFCRRDV